MIKHQNFKVFFGCGCLKEETMIDKMLVYHQLWVFPAVALKRVWKGS